MNIWDTICLALYNFATHILANAAFYVLSRILIIGVGLSMIGQIGKGLIDEKPLTLMQLTGQLLLSIFVSSLTLISLWIFKLMAYAMIITPIFAYYAAPLLTFLHRNRGSVLRMVLHRWLAYLELLKTKDGTL